VSSQGKPMGRTQEDRDMDAIRATAESKSVGCPECGGRGITTRYVDESIHKRTGEWLSVGCICHRCAMGDWIRMRRDAEQDLTLARLLDLRARPEWSNAIDRLPPAWAEGGIANDPEWDDDRPLQPGEATAMWRRVRRGLAKEVTTWA
jgi:hypothetical protein